MITKRTLLGLVVFVLVLSFGAKSYAQTPDGETPAEETVCYDQVGKAYGLCVAYCEAMDCDSEESQASPEACDKVLTNYQNATGELPPCEQQLPLCSQDVIDCGLGDKYIRCGNGEIICEFKSCPDTCGSCGNNPNFCE